MDNERMKKIENYFTPGLHYKIAQTCKELGLPTATIYAMAEVKGVRKPEFPGGDLSIEGGDFCSLAIEALENQEARKRGLKTVADILSPKTYNAYDLADDLGVPRELLYQKDGSGPAKFDPKARKPRILGADAIKVITEFLKTHPIKASSLTPAQERLFLKIKAKIQPNKPYSINWIAKFSGISYHSLLERAEKANCICPKPSKMRTGKAVPSILGKDALPLISECLQTKRGKTPKKPIFKMLSNGKKRAKKVKQVVSTPQTPRTQRPTKVDTGRFSTPAPVAQDNPYTSVLEVYRQAENVLTQFPVGWAQAALGMYLQLAQVLAPHPPELVKAVLDELAQQYK